jgi:hypothetical protein
MRYIITTTQAHTIVYKFLDTLFLKRGEKKQQNPHNPDAYSIKLESSGDLTLNYYYFGPGEYDDDGPFTPATKHLGVGHLHAHPYVVDSLRGILNIRETRVLDMIADWFSEKYEVDIDDISIYPKRKKPAAY